MSVSMYRSQVDRAGKEIANLEGKLADERARAARERGVALRAASSLTQASSQSTVRQKLKDAQRREEKAAAHDKKAAGLADQIVSKRRSLGSAQASLERALKQDSEKADREARRKRQQEDREQERRRKQELGDLRELERRRRAAQDPLPVAHSPSALQVEYGMRSPTRASTAAEFEYDVCLSFAGEDRPYVEMVAREISAKGLRVFYDQDQTSSLWGKDLAEHLDHIYREASRYCVLFVSEHYARKEWTRHERRSALARAVEAEHEYLLPARFDDTDLPGLRPTVAYIDLREYAPATVAEFLVAKVRDHNH